MRRLRRLALSLALLAGCASEPDERIDHCPCSHYGSLEQNCLCSFDRSWTQEECGRGLCRCERGTCCPPLRPDLPPLPPPVRQY